MAELQGTDGPWEKVADFPPEVRKKLVWFILLQREKEVIRAWAEAYSIEGCALNLRNVVVDMGSANPREEMRGRYHHFLSIVFGGVWCWSVQPVSLVNDLAP